MPWIIMGSPFFLIQYVCVGSCAIDIEREDSITSSLLPPSIQHGYTAVPSPMLKVWHVIFLVEFF